MINEFQQSTMLEFLFGKTSKFIQSRLIDRDIQVDPKNVCKMTAKNKFEFTEQPIIAKIKAPQAD